MNQKSTKTNILKVKDNLSQLLPMLGEVVESEQLGYEFYWKGFC